MKCEQRGIKFTFILAPTINIHLQLLLSLFSFVVIVCCAPCTRKEMCARTPNASWWCTRCLLLPDEKVLLSVPSEQQYTTLCILSMMVVSKSLLRFSGATRLLKMHTHLSPLFLLIWISPVTISQPPPFLRLTTPIQQIPFYYPPLPNVFTCEGANEITAIYQPWYSHYITPTMLPTDYTSAHLYAPQAPPRNSPFTNFGNIGLYSIPQTPIECTSSSQLRNGSCTTFYTCAYVMNGTVTPSPDCPRSLQCCMLPTCALIIGSKTRYGHCRPAATCPGIFDTILGVSVGCSDPVNAPCCVAEEVNITCPRHYSSYVNALVKSYGLLNMTALNVSTPQRVLAWAPFLLSVFDDTVGTCVKDCHKDSFLQFFMNVLSEMFMFTSGSNGLYKRLLDWKGISRGLLPSSYFSYYSPYVFSQVIRNLFQNYNLVQLFGKRSFLSAARIIDFLNKEAMGSMLATNYTSQFNMLSWRSYKYFARFSDCAPIYMDGAECSMGQGLCSIPRIPAMLNTSEYWIYCPKHLQLQYGDCADYPTNVVCCAKPYPALHFGAHLVKSEFNDVIVAIHQGQYKDDSIIQDLVKVLTNASAALYRATRGRAYFRTVTILSQWNATDGNATYETFRDADIKVVPEFSYPARTLSLGTCGEPGFGVFLSQNHLRQWGAGQTVAKLFAMNRWGFGDEVPSNPSEMFYVPDDQRQGATFRASSSCSANMVVNYQPTYGSQQQFNMTIFDPNPQSVASFAFRPDIFPEANAEFCATTTIPHCDDSRRHNPEPNTPHNRLCNRTSTLSTILRTADFDQTQNSPRFVGNTAPTFKFIQYPNVTSQVIAIVADFSGSITPSNTSMMLNAIISFLQIAPDEVNVVLVSVGPERDVVIQSEPIQPLSPFVQPTGGLHFGRQRLIEKVKEWMYFIRPTLAVKNTSVLRGIESLVDTYLPLKQYRLKILCFSDFFGVAPTDTGLLARIRQAGYSIWPVALWSKDKLFRTQLYNTIQYPLYDYAQLLANSTYGRWQFIADTTNMQHWYYAIGTFLDDNNLGTPILIQQSSINIGGSLSFSFAVPFGYTLNTSIVVDHDAMLIPVTISGSNNALYNQNCMRDDRGFQKSFRVACRFGNIANTTQMLNLVFGRDSQVYLASNDARLRATQTVTIMIISRAVEFGSAYTGDNDVPDPWLDPWRNRVAALPETYPKAEALLTKGVRISFERSAKFRFPKVYAILSLGPHALLGCPVEYDLYLSNYAPGDRVVGPLLFPVSKSVKMYDDGQGEDGFANDGVYTAFLVNATSNGTYSVHVRLPASNTPSCVVKQGVALVGYTNDNSTVNLVNGTKVMMSFYKAAGAFDLTVPYGTETVFSLGVLTVQSCGIRDVVFARNFSTDEQYKLPTSFIIYCNVIPLTVESRYSFKTSITYNLAVAEKAEQLNQQSRYWANDTGNITDIVKLPDNTYGIPLSVSMAPDFVSPNYFAVVWANDKRDNYATRSQVYAIVLPTFANNATGRFTNLPLFTDITTSFPRPDDTWPTAIIFSCVAGCALAVILIVAVVICFGQRRPSHRLLPRQPPPPYGHVDDNRLSIISGGSRHSSGAGVQPVPPVPPPRKVMSAGVPPYSLPQSCIPPSFHQQCQPQGNRRSRPPTSRAAYQRQPGQTEMMLQTPVVMQNPYATHFAMRDNGRMMGTADRQNLANLSRQNFYTMQQQPF